MFSGNAAPTGGGLSYSEWERGIPHEESFWTHWFESEGGKFKEDFYFRTHINSTTKFQDCEFLLSNVKTEGGVYQILDVGAGPLSQVGSKCGDHDIEVIPVDPLAPLYNKLLQRFNIRPYRRTQWARVEELSKVFGENFFHWTRMQNALDHSMDPMAGIIEMLKVTRPGGIVHLGHQANEAESEHYQGFHQWNIDVQNGDPVIWNQRGKINLRKHVEGIAIIECAKRGVDLKWVVIYLKKVPVHQT